MGIEILEETTNAYSKEEALNRAAFCDDTANDHQSRGWLVRWSLKPTTVRTMAATLREYARLKEREETLRREVSGAAFDQLIAAMRSAQSRLAGRESPTEWCEGTAVGASIELLLRIETTLTPTETGESA